ncbi:hypothetical protein GCM10010467_12460 [Actinocorallia glomerata]|uniref:Uncharacterized protein n=2 Tax=Actinomycetes TaxID=1760 RepID=A0ABP6LN90_9MICC
MASADSADASAGGGLNGLKMSAPTVSCVDAASFGVSVCDIVLLLHADAEAATPTLAPAACTVIPPVTPSRSLTAGATGAHP